MSDTPPPAQAFELGMHAALKAAGVKTAAEAERFFKLANAHMDYEATEQARREAFEIGARGALSNAGIKVAADQDVIIKEAIDLNELLAKAKETGGAAVDKTKRVGKAVGGAAKGLGEAALGKAQPAISKIKEKAPGVAGGLRDFIKRRLKTLGIG